jgi:C4-dicarboxylate transporter DctM subunit
MESAVLLSVSLILLLTGVPIGIAIGVGIVALIFVNPIIPFSYMASSMYASLNSFPLLAVPIFILAGAVMETGGLSKRLVNVANKLLGHTPGSLGNVTIVACFFFGAISGSSPATVAAIGMIMIPEMVKAGYDRYYATGLVTVAGGLGIVVPPSIPMVIYGVTNGISIGNLFLSGFGPALVLSLILGAINIFLSRKRGYQIITQRFNLKALGKASADAVWALLMPVIILGGIYGGIFTPTEAACVSLVYGVVVSVFVYKELTWARVWKTFFNNMPLIGGMMLTFAPIAAMGAVFVYLNIPNTITNAVLSASDNLYLVLAIFMIVMIPVGMFVPYIPSMIVLSPLMLGIVTKLGMDPIQFGMLMIMNTEIAFLTPPVATNIFIASSMTGFSMDKIFKHMLPFFIGAILAMVTVAYVPQVSLFLLDLFHIPH